MRSNVFSTFMFMVNLRWLPHHVKFKIGSYDEIILNNSDRKSPTIWQQTGMFHRWFFSKCLFLRLSAIQDGGPLGESYIIWTCRKIDYFPSYTRENLISEWYINSHWMIAAKTFIIVWIRKNKLSKIWILVWIESYKRHWVQTVHQQLGGRYWFRWISGWILMSLMNNKL